MDDVNRVFDKTRTAAEKLQDVLAKDDSTLDDVKRAAGPFDDIEAELERLLKDG